MNNYLSLDTNNDEGVFRRDTSFDYADNWEFQKFTVPQYEINWMNENDGQKKILFVNNNKKE